MNWFDRFSLLDLVRGLGVLVVLLVVASTLLLRDQLGELERAATELNRAGDLATEMQDLRYYTI